MLSLTVCIRPFMLRDDLGLLQSTKDALQNLHPFINQQHVLGVANLNPHLQTLLEVPQQAP